MRFANVNYPKLQFAMGGFLEEEQFDKALALAGTETVTKLLTGGGFAPRAAAAADSKPKGKPLPQDEEPSAGPESTA